MSATIYLEGGGDTNELRSRCREGFRKLLENCGFDGRMPQLVACGGRNRAYERFAIEQANKRNTDYVAMLIDSEVPLDELHAVWEHLKKHDGWEQPDGADDSQVLLMTTCMETWITADRKAIAKHYGKCLRDSVLPSTDDLELRSCHSIQQKLVDATSNCSAKYAKGKRSFEILAKLSPDELEKHLPSFSRARSILDERL